MSGSHGPHGFVSDRCARICRITSLACEAPEPPIAELDHIIEYMVETQAARRARADTEPAPPPTPSTLGERMAAAGYVVSDCVETDEGVTVRDCPMARDTERGT